MREAPKPAKLSVQIRTRRARKDEGGVGDEASFSLDVAFDAAVGITILFGPSGCGKSTTLAAIAGLLRPDAGRIALGDDVWFDSARGIDRPPHLRGVAFVFQSLALFPHMTAAHNVSYGMDRHLSASEKRQRAEKLLARLKVGHFADRRPATFSGGEAQRVALARAFAMSPRIALFDEPFSAMDRQLRKDLDRRRTQLRRGARDSARPRDASAKRGARAGRSRHSARGRTHRAPGGSTGAPSAGGQPRHVLRRDAARRSAPRHGRSAGPSLAPVWGRAPDRATSIAGSARPRELGARPQSQGHLRGFQRRYGICLGTLP